MSHGVIAPYAWAANLLFAPLRPWRTSLPAVLLSLLLALSSTAESKTMDPRPKGPEFSGQGEVLAKLREAEDRLKNRLPDWFKKNIPYVLETRWIEEQKFMRIHDSDHWSVQYESKCRRQGTRCRLEEKWLIKALVHEWRKGKVEWYPRLYENRVLNDLILSANNKALNKVLKLLKETSYGQVVAPEQAALEAIKKLQTLGKYIPVIGEIIIAVNDARDIEKLTGKISEIQNALVKFREEVGRVQGEMGQPILAWDVMFHDAQFVSAGWEKIDTYVRNTKIPCTEFELSDPQPRQDLELSEDQRRQLYRAWRLPEAQRDYSFLPGFPVSCWKKPKPTVAESDSRLFDSEIKDLLDAFDGAVVKNFDSISSCDENSYRQTVSELNRLRKAMESIHAQRETVFDETIKNTPAANLRPEDIKRARTPLSNAETVLEAIKKRIRSLKKYPEPCVPRKGEPAAVLRGKPNVPITAEAAGKSTQIRTEKQESRVRNCKLILDEIDRVYATRGVFMDQQVHAELEVLKLETNFYELKIEALKANREIDNELREIERKLESAKNYRSNIQTHIDELKAREEELGREYNACIEEGK